MRKRIGVAMKNLGLALVLAWLPTSGISAQPSPQANPEMTEQDILLSPQTGVDYTRLRDLLAQQQWRQANDLTRELMQKAAGREAQGWVSTQEIEKFPCWDLKTIDNLWKAYSQGRFGFSVQFPIFVSTGNKPGRLVASEAYDEFGDKVGWREPNPNPPERGPRNQWIIFRGNLNYSLDAPVGHLPNPRAEYQITGGRLEYTVLTQRMVQCNIVSPPERTTKK